MTTTAPPVAPSLERGTTTVAPVVFERLATRAATEVEGVVGEVTSGISRFFPWTSGSPADASAEVDEEGVVLDLTINVAYPEPVRQVAQNVRQHVTERVRSCTGRRVHEVNITVSELIPVTPRARRLR
ncbi:MAG: Asp23/Gls24 family envelope stress response protein [Actinobacteria bacterium]|nr:Asp23/Gls24 family envelope stress response protein [Actinomycetota bacterium]